MYIRLFVWLFISWLVGCILGCLVLFSSLIFSLSLFWREQTLCTPLYHTCKWWWHTRICVSRAHHVCLCFHSWALRCCGPFHFSVAVFFLFVAPYTNFQCAALLCILCYVHASISMLTNVCLPFHLFFVRLNDTSYGSPIATLQYFSQRIKRNLYTISFHSVRFFFSKEMYWALGTNIMWASFCEQQTQLEKMNMIAIFSARLFP